MLRNSQLKHRYEQAHPVMRTAMTKDDFLIRSRYGYVNLDYIEIMRLKQLFAYTAPSGYLCQMPGGEVKRVRSLHAALLRRRMIVRNSLLFLRQVHGELSEAQRESEVGLGEWPRDLFWNEGGFATSIMSLDPPKSFRRMDESEIDVEGVAYFTVSYVVFEREAREFSSSLSLSLSHVYLFLIWYPRASQLYSLKSQEYHLHRSFI